MIIRDLDFFSLNEEKRSVRPHVEVKAVKASVALPRSNLPGLDYALNPYIGCEHGCLYCFAPEVVKRPREEWAKRVEVRANLPNLLSRELRTKRGVIGIGTVTDPYQPLEEVCLLTRKCLMEISRHDNPISILSKSDLIRRDSDLICSCHRPEVGITITTAHNDLSQALEPGAPTPARRLEVLRHFVPLVNTYAMVGPLMPFLDRCEVKELVQALASTGTKRVMLDRLRLRPGLNEVFEGMRDEKVMVRLIRSLSDPDRADQVEAWLRDLCAESGLKVENAF